MNLLKNKRLNTKEELFTPYDDNKVALLQEKLNGHIENDNEVLIRLNNLLQYMTQLDYVKAVIADVNKQSTMVENIAASSEEVSAATEDISNFIQNTYKATSDSIINSEESVHKINNTFRQIEDIIEKTNTAQKNMDQVNSRAKEIDEMVEIIKKVANQTNLLALNASIEAARAGEQGKGFSVVANEIKALAANTKKQADFIQSIVMNLTSEITETSLSLHDATNSFDQTKNDMNEAVNSINNMKNILNGVNKSFMEISANIEEQTAASEEIANSLQVVSVITETVKDKTIRTGKAFYDISKIIDEVRILCYEKSENTTLATQIEICISDHLVWRWRIYNMILGNVVFDNNAVGTHLTCRLGKWLIKMDKSNEEAKKLADELEIPHSQLHKLAKEAIERYNSADFIGSEETLKKMDLASTDIIKLLRQLQEIFK